MKFRVKVNLQPLTKTPFSIFFEATCLMLSIFDVPRYTNNIYDIKLDAFSNKMEVHMP